MDSEIIQNAIVHKRFKRKQQLLFLVIFIVSLYFLYFKLRHFSNS